MCACCNWPAHTQTRTHMETHAKPSSKSSHIALLTKNSLLLLIPLSFSISPHTPFLSPPLCHSFIPAHTSAPLKTVQNSALLASGFSFLSFLFVVFFFQAKDFACGYNLDMSHAHRSHRPIAVIVGQSYCHISGLITTAICGSHAGRQTAGWTEKKFFALFTLFINGENAKK